MMYTGALILLIGLLIGYYVGRTYASSLGPKPPKPIETVCGCHHHLALHDRKTGKCSGDTEHVTHYTNGVPRKWVFYPCVCKHYVGPEFLPQYIAPEISEG